MALYANITPHALPEYFLSVWRHTPANRIHLSRYTQQLKRIVRIGLYLYRITYIEFGRTVLSRKKERK